jgi:predicted permease
MKIASGLRRFFRLSAFRPDPDGDLEAELSFHLKQTEEEFLAQGFSPTEAREEARRRFGNLDQYRSELGRMSHRAAARSRWLGFLENLGQDLAYLFRGLRREPGFTAAVVLTLALGIGANTTLFGVVDHLLLTPPAHVKNPDTAVRLQVHRFSPFSGEPETMSYQTYNDYRDFLGASNLESVAAFGDQELILGRGEEAARINAVFATTSYFPLLGVDPGLGRFFDESEDEPGASDVAILTHDLWQNRFGGREDILGQTLSIGDGNYSVIGVAPEGFNGVDLAPVDLFLPIHAYTTFEGSDRWTTHRGYYWIQVIARLPSPSSRQAAIDEATARHRNGRQELIDEGRYSEDARIVLGSIKAALGPDAPEEVQVARWLIGVTFIVLLIACANVANLLLARGARRRRELGIRVALGISRRRLVGQLLLESTVLAGLGGAVGLAMAYWGGQALRTTFLPDVAWNVSPVNSRVLLFTMAVALITGLLAGMAPAWRGADEGMVDTLKEWDRGGTGRRSLGQAALLVTQAALSVILLVGAGLFVQSLHRAQTMDMGLDPGGVILAELQLDGEWEPAARFDLATRAVERLASIPGVEKASMASATPFRGMMAFDISVPGHDSIPLTRGLGPFVTSASSDYLSTVGIQLREGRMFTDQDGTVGARVTVVTANMADGLWPTQSALGQCIIVNDEESPCWEVVGVVENSRLTNLTGEVPWQYYLPMGSTVTHLEEGPGALFVKAQGDPRALLPIVRQELRTLDPAIRFAHVRPLQAMVEPHLRPWRLGATMFSLFGVLALVVAMVGLYSVLAFNVARRTRELGVRSAMGASRTRLLNMVLRQAVGVTTIGVLLGLGVAYFAANKLGPLLFSTSPRDPAVLLGVGATLLVVAFFAAAIPAWAAARVDPMTALRAD